MEQMSQQFTDAVTRSLYEIESWEEALKYICNADEKFNYAIVKESIQAGQFSATNLVRSMMHVAWHQTLKDFIQERGDVNLPAWYSFRPRLIEKMESYFMVFDEHEKKIEL